MEAVMERRKKMRRGADAPVKALNPLGYVRVGESVEPSRDVVSRVLEHARVVKQASPEDAGVRVTGEAEVESPAYLLLQAYGYSARPLLFEPLEPVADGEVAVARNRDGGYDVFIHVDGSVTVFSVHPSGTVTVACSECTPGRVARAYAAGYLYVLAAVKALATGDPFNRSLNDMKMLVDQLGSDVGPEAVAGFIADTLGVIAASGKLSIARIPAEAEEALRPGAASAAVRKLFSGRLEESLVVEVYAEQRRKLEALVESLKQKFGVLSTHPHEWALMLAFAVAASANYTEPPIVLHAVGDVGTFKTTGPILLARHLRKVEARVKAGGDPAEAYEKLLAVLEKHGIPSSKIRGTVGGLVTSLSTEGGLEVGLDMAFLYSLIGEEETGELLGELEKAGFRVEIVETPVNVEVVDPANLANIDDHRFIFKPDKHLGILKVYTLFSNDIVIIDEGSRNPYGLETLLTKMSLSSLNESVRVIIVADNIEPFMEVLLNERFTPLHDRTYKVITKAIKDDSVVAALIRREPTIKMTTLDLVAIKKAIDAMPVETNALVLLKTVANALGYVFLSVVKNNVFYLKPVRRRQATRLKKETVVIDPVDIGDASFIPGGRLVYHTLLLAKFNAFLRGASKVAMTDLKRALAVTTRSRLVVEASDYTSYKLHMVRLARTISEIVKNSDYIVETVESVVKALEGDMVKAKELEEKLRKSNSEKLLGPIIMTGVEIYAAEKPVRIRHLPPSLRMTVAAMLIEKEDVYAIEEIIDELSIDEI